MDPSKFMLPSRSMMTAEYDLRRPGIPYTKQVTDELDYDEFSETRLCPPLLVWYVFLLLLSSFNHSSFCIIGDIQMEHLCQVGPIAGAPIDPPCLP